MAFTPVTAAKAQLTNIRLTVRFTDEGGNKDSRTYNMVALGKTDNDYLNAGMALAYLSQNPMQGVQTGKTFDLADEG
jgi:hypothetical protein